MKFFSFTDGACKGNPGPGGWAYRTHSQSNPAGRENYLEFGSGYEVETTNNKMELQAVIEAMKSFYNHVDTFRNEYNVHDIEYEIVSDSKYVVDGINIWMPKWKQNNMISATGKPVKNLPFWESLLKIRFLLKEKGIDVAFSWVKGHDTEEFNNQVDILASEKADEAESIKNT